MNNTQDLNIGVVGSGSWATAIVKMLCEHQKKINWWVRNEYISGYIKHNGNNPNYLTSVNFKTSQLKLMTNINKVFTHSDIVILATPSIYLEDALSKLKIPINDKIIFSAIKGIVPGYKDIVGHYLHHKYEVPYEKIGVITGPCHAEEVALERLSYLTIAAKEENTAKTMSDLIKSRFIKTTLSDDIFGTEYAAVLKNIFAIAAGIFHGLGYGDNFQAVLMSNAIREMENFLNKIYPLKRDIKNSAYLGDLLVTGYSFFSRNRMLGNMIGKGYTVRSAILEMNMVAEGYYASPTINELAKQHHINMPICSAVYEVLYKQKNPELTFKNLTEKLD